VVFRLDVALGVAVAAVVLGSGMATAARKAGLIGLALGLLPWVPHLLIAGPSSVFHGLVTDPLQLQAGNKLPVPPDPNHLSGFIESFINFARVPWPFPRPSSSAQLTAWFFFMVFALVATIAVAVWALARARTPRARVLLTLGLLGVTFMPTVLQRADAAHLNNVASIVFPSLVFAGSELVTVFASGRARTALDALNGIVVLVLVCGLTATWTAASYWDDVLVSAGVRDQKSVRITHDGRSFYVDRLSHSEVNDVLRTVDRTANPGDRLLVGPADLRRTPYIDSMFYYLLPHLDPATRFIYMNPAVALHNSKELDDDLRSADVLVLSKQWANWREPNDSVKFGPATANEIVQREFCRVPLEEQHPTQYYEVYRRCRR
jgi:hypothetical protein